MNDLPLIGRSAYDLAFLAPGVTQPALGTASIPVLTPIEGSSGSNFISNGGRNITDDVLLDGVTTTANDYQVLRLMLRASARIRRARSGIRTQACSIPASADPFARHLFPSTT